MLIDDAVLPAAAHLTGPGASDVLGAAVAAAGGRLEHARACQVQYRPGHDVVVRFEASVSWAGHGPVAETLLASTARHGPPAGTLPVEAVTERGVDLAVGVWRWPFDPVVSGLAAAVTPSAAARFLDGVADGPVRLEVVAYRPTQRAVVRAIDGAGTTHYVKAVAPKAAESLAHRHEVLGAAGVPVPPITRVDPELGLVAMAALDGPTVRERLRSGAGPWPDADEFRRITDALSSVTIPDARSLPGRVAAAMRHSAMLAEVLPGDRWRLDRLTDRLAAAAERSADRCGPTIHGDLYEAQLVTAPGTGGGATITGVLDIDDVGPGDPIDDRATVLAHLLVRVRDRESGASGRRPIAGYMTRLRQRFALDVDPVDLDLVTAAALVGLATGPFRVQQRGWQHEVRRRLGLAERLIRHAGEEHLRVAS